MKIQSEKKKEGARVLSQEMIAADIYDMWLETSLAKTAVPGQFIGLYPHDKSTLLPRPVSICEKDEQRNALRIVYRIAGKGTAEFSAYEPGEEVQVLGMLGNGFPLEEGNNKRIVLLGGGIGIPPMVELAKTFKKAEENVTVIVGYRDNQLFLKKDLEQFGTVYAATEDGSAGTKGNVLTVMEEKKLSADVIMACGPMPMLRAIKRFAQEKGIKAYISLEERMACGVGACLGCVCKTKEKDPHSHVNNARICTDGPVFDAADVDI